MANSTVYMYYLEPRLLAGRSREWGGACCWGVRRRRCSGGHLARNGGAGEKLLNRSARGFNDYARRLQLATSQCRQRRAGAHQMGGAASTAAAVLQTLPKKFGRAPPGGPPHFMCGAQVGGIEREERRALDADSQSYERMPVCRLRIWAVGRLRICQEIR